MDFHVVWFGFVSPKDPEGSEVGIIEGRNGTGIASFPDFEIPSNPKYVKAVVIF